MWATQPPEVIMVEKWWITANVSNLWLFIKKGTADIKVTNYDRQYWKLKICFQSW